MGGLLANDDGAAAGGDWMGCWDIILRYLASVPVGACGGMASSGGDDPKEGGGEDVWADPVLGGSVGR